MPRKNKPRKPVTVLDKVWRAPRPANTSEPRTFEPIGIVRSNRYLEFADIAFGANKTAPRKKKPAIRAIKVEHNRPDERPEILDQHAKGKVTPINAHKRPNFGAFRSSH
jgi:hypothetical protein